MARIQPAELKLTYTLSDDGVTYVDVMKDLSLINRKFLRQGCQVAISDVELTVDQSASPISLVIERLPHHWVMVNSWSKAMNEWLTQQNEAMRASGQESMIAAYRDFKIFMDDGHAQLGHSAHPDDYLTAATAAGISPTATLEWNYSQVVVPNQGGVPGQTADYKLFAVGADTANGRSIIQAYADGRARPQAEDPNIVDAAMGGLYGEMENTGDDFEEIQNFAVGENSHPPYLIDYDTAFEFYPGGGSGNGLLTIQDRLIVRNGSTFGSDHSGPFMANCGLLKLTAAGGVAAADTVQVRLTIAAGKYRGVGARPMQEVN